MKQNKDFVIIEEEKNKISFSKIGRITRSET